jgi:hypothetical protein
VTPGVADVILAAMMPPMVPPRNARIQREVPSKDEPNRSKPQVPIRLLLLMGTCVLVVGAAFASPALSALTCLGGLSLLFVTVMAGRAKARGYSAYVGIRLGLWVLLFHAVVAIPFLFWTRLAPLHDVWGDVYRGFPFPFGLDEGDVIGIPILKLAYFSLPGFFFDIAISVLCSLPVSLALIWSYWRTRRSTGRDGVNECKSQ